ATFNSNWRPFRTIGILSLASVEDSSFFRCALMKSRACAQIAASLMKQRDRMRQDFVADREPGDGGSDASDNAGCFHAQRHWRADANVPASASHDVVPVANTRSVYLNQH